MKKMTDNLLFDFTVDKEAQKVFITREFAAEQSLVWEAFTNPAILDEWMAPAPFTARTKYMNFEPGGKRFYAMVGADGKESWALQTFTSISPITNFTMYNAFADKDENPEATGSEWDYQFSETGGITTVKITIYNESFERMERVLEGFKLGFTATLVQLENILARLSKK
jgi:uncharacterized protein YndB with AHSA1/START domain